MVMLSYTPLYWSKGNILYSMAISIVFISAVLVTL